MATSARLVELQQKFQENPRRYFAPLANEHRKLGELDQAISLCRSHLAHQPQHVSGQIVLGQALFEAGETADARAAFETALSLDHENLIALRFMGDIARRDGNPGRAREWYLRVLNADPRNDEIAGLLREVESAPEAPQGEADAEALASLGGWAAEPGLDNPAPEQPPAHEDAVVDLASAWELEIEQQHVTASEESPQPVLEWTDDETAALTTAVPQEQPAEARNFTQDLTEFPLAESDATEPSLPDWVEAHGAAAASEDTPAFEVHHQTSESSDDWVGAAAATESQAEAVSEPFAESAAPLADIDYSMFEAVADEELIEAAPPPAPPVLPAAAEETDESGGDDWFASVTPGPDADSGDEGPAFDLDAAFQQVLPNEPATADMVQAAADPDDAASLADAYAELDRVTAQLEADLADPGALMGQSELPSDDLAAGAFASFEESPGFDGFPEPAIAADDPAAGSSWDSAAPTPEFVEALSGRTPEAGVPVVEQQSAAFVTETMAELYLQQGFRAEALAVYRQLLALHPDDANLADRVRSLEGGNQPDERDEPQPEPALAADAAVPAAAAEPPAEAAAPARVDPLGQSVRSFLGVLVRRTPPQRAAAPSQPMSRPRAASGSEPGLAALLGAPREEDAVAAHVLAGAFAEPNGDADRMPGRPTRRADAELSLGDVFGEDQGASAAAPASFDEFFNTGSVNTAPPSPLDEEGSDMEQFTAWLEGLKKK